MSNANDILNHDAKAGALSSRLVNEELFGLTELTKRLPKINGRRPAVCTLWRWCLKGIHGVRLEHVRRGMMIATSLQAVDRFSAMLATTRIEQWQEEPRGFSPPACRSFRPTSPATRQRQIEAAKKRLEEAGI
jgi:hypothetical protein